MRHRFTSLALFGLVLASHAAAADAPEAWKKWIADQENGFRTDPVSPLTVVSATNLGDGKHLFLKIESAAKVSWGETAPVGGFDVELRSQADRAEFRAAPADAFRPLPDAGFNARFDLLLTGGKHYGDTIRLYVSDPRNPLRTGFKGFVFYPYDPKAVVEGRLTRLAQPEPVRLGTTAGQVRDGFRIGKVSFALNGAQHSLSVYAFGTADSKNLELMFKDGTTGKETYPVGRYIDLEGVDPSASTLKIDFNFAHQPYCAINHAYSCILVPPGNGLPFPVRAGERQLPTGH